MKGLPAIWFGLILLALMTALTFWIDRAVQPPAPKRDGSARHDPDYTVSRFLATRADVFGNPRYDLAGDEMRHYPDDDSTELLRPRYTIYSSKTQPTQVVSDKGEVSSNGENIYFVDNVKVVRAGTAAKGEMTLLTSYLHAIPDQGLAQTDRPVTILQAPHTVVHATGMQYYKQDGILKLLHRVKVHYERPAARPIKALTIEQVAGKRLFVDKVSSVVKPLSPVTSVLPLQKAAVEKPTAKSARNKAAVASGTKTVEHKFGGVPKRQANHEKRKNKMAGGAQARPANNANKTGTTPSRVRRHYEKP